VKLIENEYAACEGADALVLATEWSEYRAPDLPRIKAAMRGRHIFDGRNVLVPNAVVDAGLVYRGMGRPQRSPVG
jgi:UDPglucose 6-dehydrogenase